METFPTSALKDLTWVFATTTKICTRYRFMQPHGNNSARHPYLPTRELKTLKTLPFSHKKICASLQFTAGYKIHALTPSFFRADWFGRWVVTHSLADSNFHGHRPAVYINQHLLWLLMSISLGSLTPRLVHPTSPVLLTKNGPLKVQHSHCQCATKAQKHLTDLKFENKLTSLRC